MSGVLFLAHRVPFPPDRGDKIRSHHVLHALARMGPVHVGCLSDEPAASPAEGELSRIAASAFVSPRRGSLVSAGIKSLARGQPGSLAAFYCRDLAAWVADRLSSGEIDTVYVFSGQMGQYVPSDWQGRLIVDLVDVDSTKFESYAADAAVPMRWVYRREARLLAAEETRLAAIADQVLLVSGAEAGLFRSRLPAGLGARVHAVGNGIDCRNFDPAATEPHPELAGNGAHVIFTGQMDYPPNVAAAIRMIDRIMPLVLARIPDCRFHVVGRCPTTELLARDGTNGSRVWGEVADVRPFLAAASVVAAPLEIARGVQNKVLEAMAMARPVVLSAEAAAGLPGCDGIDFMVAGGDREFADRIVGLLLDSDLSGRMGLSARRCVQESRNWDEMLAPLRLLVVGHDGLSGQRDAA